MKFTNLHQTFGLVFSSASFRDESYSVQMTNWGTSAYEVVFPFELTRSISLVLHGLTRATFVEKRKNKKIKQLIYIIYPIPPISNIIHNDNNSN